MSKEQAEEYMRLRKEAYENDKAPYRIYVGPSEFTDEELEEVFDVERMLNGKNLISNEEVWNGDMELGSSDLGSSRIDGLVDDSSDS